MGSLKPFLPAHLENLMILDRLEHADRYLAIHPGIAKAISYLEHKDLSGYEVGKHAIDGDNLFVIIDEYETVAVETTEYESHKTYIDLQVILKGQEDMGILPLNGQTPSKAYNPEKDFQLFSRDEPNGFMITVTEGMFAIFFPTDAHMPCIGVPAKPVRKAVFKIRA